MLHGSEVARVVSTFGGCTSRSSSRVTQLGVSGALVRGDEHEWHGMGWRMGRKMGNVPQ